MRELALHPVIGPCLLALGMAACQLVGRTSCEKSDQCAWPRRSGRLHTLFSTHVPVQVAPPAALSTFGKPPLACNQAD